MSTSIDRNEGCVTKLRVLADRTRLAVLRELLPGPRRVGELNRHLAIPQSLLSHHLRVLRDAGLVAAERRGKGVVYRLAPRVRVAPGEEAIDLGCCRLSFR